MRFIIFLFLFYSYIFALPYNSIVIDGSLNEWDQKNERITEDEEIGDSKAHHNDIKSVYVSWDKKNLYLAVDCLHKDMGMIIFFSYDEKSGSKDLTEIPSWNRKVVSEKPINLFFASWNNARGNFYKVLSPKEVSDISWYFNYTNNNNIYELSLPLSILFPYQQTIIPKNAEIHFVICLVTGDIEGKYGYVSSDTFPDNTIPFNSTTTLVNFYTIKLDMDADGVPDDYHDVTTTKIETEVSPKIIVPYGGNNKTNIKISANIDSQLVIKVIEPQTGKVMKTIAEEYLNKNEQKNFYWYGKDNSNNFVPQGLYIINIKVFDSKQSYIKNYPVCVIK